MTVPPPARWISRSADGRIGRVRGANSNSYTAGVICAKVARYAERLYHPDRLMHPCAAPAPRVRAAGSRFPGTMRSTRSPMPSSRPKRGTARGVWPYYYAGTMGWVQRDSASTACATPSAIPASSIRSAPTRPGPAFMGTGALRGPDPREMAKSDCVVIWGTNAVHPGQCDDARHPRPQGARRQDRRHRHLRQPDDEAGRYEADPASPARMRRLPAPSCTSPSATAMPTAPTWQIRRRSRRELEAHLKTRRRMGGRDHRPFGR
jgi:anaerobic selenocysteine-containing dehydrogenase